MDGPKPFQIWWVWHFVDIFCAHLTYPRQSGKHNNQIFTKPGKVSLVIPCRWYKRKQFHFISSWTEWISTTAIISRIILWLHLVHAPGKERGPSPLPLISNNVERVATSVVDPGFAKHRSTIWNGVDSQDSLVILLALLYRVTQKNSENLLLT